MYQKPSSCSISAILLLINNFYIHSNKANCVHKASEERPLVTIECQTQVIAYNSEDSQFCDNFKSQLKF